MYYVICAAFIAMIGFYGAVQHLKRQPKRRKALTIACKCAATGMAVLVGVLGAARSGLPSNRVTPAGRLACMLAAVYRADPGGHLAVQPLPHAGKSQALLPRLCLCDGAVRNGRAGRRAAPDVPGGGGAVCLFGRDVGLPGHDGA